MEWIGIMALLGAILCLWMVCLTGRRDWLFGLIGCFILLLSGYDLPKEGPNGLVILIAISMILVSILPLIRIKIWNISKRSSPIWLECVFFMIFALEIGYCAFQLPQLHFLYEVMQVYEPGAGVLSLISVVARALSLLVGVSIMALLMTRALLGAIDRIFSKRGKLILIRCRVFSMKIFQKCYFLEGINNGITYHFQITFSMYLILKGQKSMKLDVLSGCLGGLYVSKNPLPELTHKAKKRNIRVFVWSIILALLTGFGVFAWRYLF